MAERALALTNGLFDTVFAKTTHGLIRGPSRFPLAGVIDSSYVGQDAGMVLDGRRRGIPFYDSVAHALRDSLEPITHCIVGVATVGGHLPDALRKDLETAARAGLTLVNGLHYLLSEDMQLATIAAAHSARIVDIRKPRPAAALRFWSGDVLLLPICRVAVLGTDCAIGKRTTCMMLREACRARDIRAEMIYTGQTGWLQGLKHGFIFDATLNDFVSGELEGAILRCYAETAPDVILMEGQSGLRNPAGPAGSELVLSGAAHGVIMQHAPQRLYFEDFEERGCALPPLNEEIALVRLLGAPVWAVTLFTRGMSRAEALAEKEELADHLGLPVVLPLEEGVAPIVEIIQENL